MTYFKLVKVYMCPKELTATLLTSVTPTTLRQPIKQQCCQTVAKDNLVYIAFKDDMYLAYQCNYCMTIDYFNITYLLTLATTFRKI